MNNNEKSATFVFCHWIKVIHDITAIHCISNHSKNGLWAHTAEYVSQRLTKYFWPGVYFLHSQFSKLCKYLLVLIYFYAPNIQINKSLVFGNRSVANIARNTDHLSIKSYPLLYWVKPLKTPCQWLKSSSDVLRRIPSTDTNQITGLVFCVTLL